MFLKASHVVMIYHGFAIFKFVLTSERAGVTGCFNDTNQEEVRAVWPLFLFEIKI